MRASKKSLPVFRLKLVALAIAACFSPCAFANPVGPSVVNGAASFAVNGNTLTVTNTPGAIVNWQQFNIGAGQTTQFIQQSAQSSVLNRVIGPDPSQILGILQSNGRVYLINPSGILFGAGAVVDVGGLIASTLNITNADFLMNRMSFNGNSGTSVVNQGTITTPFGGSVYLIGNNVSNEGVITTPQGAVVLAAGNSVSMVNTVTPHVSVTVSAPAGGQAVNLGQVTAQGGSINIYASLIKQQGLLSADSASVNAQGQIVLSASQTVEVAAGSSTSAANSNGVGGTVQILGNQVNVAGAVDASGSAGGGTILVGGDFQGKNAAVQNAANTTVASTATLKADALVNGNGGKVVVWADGTTSYNGAITAKGGALGGNGGNVEVSGKGVLDFKGTVNTLAPNGTGGSLLLDPFALCISSTACAYWDVVTGTYTSPSSSMTGLTLKALVAANGATTVRTSGYGGGHLLVSDSIVFTPGELSGGKTLTLQADNGELAFRNTTIDATGGSGALNLNLISTGHPAYGGWIGIDSSTIMTNGGNIYINAPGGVSIGTGYVNGPTAASTVATAGGNISIVAANVEVGSPWSTGTNISTGNGNVSITTNAVFGGGNSASILAGKSMVVYGGTAVNWGTGSLVVNGVTDPISSGAGALTIPSNQYWGANTNGALPLSSFAGNFSGTSIVDPMAGGGTMTWSITVNATGQVTMTGSGPNTNNQGIGQLYPLSNGTFMIHFPGGLTVWGSVDPATGTLTGIWGVNGNTLGQQGSVPQGMNWGTFTSVAGGGMLQQLCTLNPALCSPTVITPPTPPVNPGTSILDNNTAIADLTFSGGLNAEGGTMWITYDDVRESRDEARKAEREKDAAEERVKTAKTPKEKEDAKKHLASKTAEVELKKADASIRETESEVRAANEEVRAAKTPEDRMRAENRKSVAESKRAEAEVKKADAEVKQAEAEAKHAEGPAARAAAESKKQAAESKRAEAEVKKAEVDAKKAETELKQVEAAAGANEVPQAEVETKKAEVAVMKAEAEMKQAEAEAKTAKDPEAKALAETKLAAAEVKKAQAEAKQAEAEVKQEEAKTGDAGVPADQRKVEAKKAEAEVKQAEAETKQAKLEEKSAKDPEAKSKSEETVAKAEAKQAEAEAKAAKIKADEAKDSPEARHEAEAKQANAEAKKAEVEAKTARDDGGRSQAEAKRAAAEAKRAESEEQVAREEVKRARDEEREAKTPESKYVASKKIEASEARAAAKREEAAVKRAESEMKRVEAEVKQAEIDVKEAATPEQRASAEKRIAEKRNEFATKRGEVAEKSRRAESVKELAESKESEFKETKQRRDDIAETAFAGIDVKAMSKDRVQDAMAARHEFMKDTLAPALTLLKRDPNAGIKACVEGGGEVCIKSSSQVPAYIANPAVEVRPRVQLPPLAVPAVSFLPQIQRKIAVVVGNNAYQDPNLPSLNGAIRDADAIANVFQEKMGYEVRVVHNGTRADIISALNKVADEVGSNDSVVLYYAGHGYQDDATKVGYWIPSDASTRNADNWITSSEINKMLTNIPAKQLMLVSDSCYSGALTNEQKVTGNALNAAKAEDILAKRSVIVMSSGGDEPVFDEGREGHSSFTWHLMDKLNKVEKFDSGADVFASVKQGLAQDGLVQTPQYGASLTAGHAVGGDYLYEVRQY
ncbi:MAG TPA: caspase family protein [Gallionella sp.]|nr:caspase family protein [Gallionella sp.]